MSDPSTALAAPRALAQKSSDRLSTFCCCCGVWMLLLSLCAGAAAIEEEENSTTLSGLPSALAEEVDPDCRSVNDRSLEVVGGFLVSELELELASMFSPLLRKAVKPVGPLRVSPHLSRSNITSAVVDLSSGESLAAAARLLGFLPARGQMNSKVVHNRIDLVGV
jgi:hypothetical protein